ncbi:hypothetical protein HF086_001966 [Spodoptera exigua]|uniref:Aldehyde dehydrogenase domain-containing protein n=1 Tax=Spodoptera exigua TaxID=7107 RepID=A0A922SK66_SPOEX|nr:hypothetical protein HF086_001966 [Spodoptera exigua]
MLPGFGDAGAALVDHPDIDKIAFTGSRTFVEDKIYDKFVEMSAERAKRRVIDAEQQNRILSLIESGKKQGAKLVAGGGRGSDTGYFVQPTVFSDVKDHMDIATTEIFGPVQQILKFSQLDEVVERANNSDYGLAAAVFTQDIDKANYVVQRLRAGTVWVNDYNVLSNQVPFGGYKQSGIGRENGPYGINNYTEVKSVITKLKEKSS